MKDNFFHGPERVGEEWFCMRPRAHACARFACFPAACEAQFLTGCGPGVGDPCINKFLGQYSTIWPGFRRITAIRNEEIIQVHGGGRI